jgi:hypothetical protein
VELLELIADAATDVAVGAVTVVNAALLGTVDVLNLLVIVAVVPERGT